MDYFVFFAIIWFSDSKISKAEKMILKVLWFELIYHYFGIGLWLYYHYYILLRMFDTVKDNIMIICLVHTLQYWCNLWSCNMRIDLTTIIPETSFKTQWKWKFLFVFHINCNWVATSVKTIWLCVNIKSGEGKSLVYTWSLTLNNIST